MPKLPANKVINLSSSSQEIRVPTKAALTSAAQADAKRTAKRTSKPAPTDDETKPAISPANADPKLNALMSAGAIYLNLSSEGDILFNSDPSAPAIATIANNPNQNFTITISYLGGKKVEPAIVQTKVILIADTLSDARTFLNEKGFH